MESGRVRPRGAPTLTRRRDCALRVRLATQAQRQKCKNARTRGTRGRGGAERTAQAWDGTYDEISAPNGGTATSRSEPASRSSPVRFCRPPGFSSFSLTPAKLDSVGLLPRLGLAPAGNTCSMHCERGFGAECESLASFFLTWTAWSRGLKWRVRFGLPLWRFRRVVGLAAPCSCLIPVQRTVDQRGVGRGTEQHGAGGLQHGAVGRGR